MVHIYKNFNRSSNAELIWKLRSIGLFKNLTEIELGIILECSHNIQYEAEENLFYEKDKPDGFYLVLSGSLQIYIYSGKPGQPPKLLKKLSVGEHVGEMSLIDGKPRSASVKTLVASELLFLPTLNFTTMIDSNPKIASSIVNSLIDTVLQLPKYKIESARTRALLEQKMIKPNLESMRTLCMMIRENNNRIAIY
jgi:CRP-like cAMP-binding protein